MPFDKRTRATFRKAELGFLGVMVLTCKHTPRFCGQRCMAGCLGLRYCWRRGLGTSWLIVGIHHSRRSIQGKARIFLALQKHYGIPGPLGGQVLNFPTDRGVSKKTKTIILPRPIPPL